jgi:hypothetical protein
MAGWQLNKPMVICSTIPLYMVSSVQSTISPSYVVRVEENSTLRDFSLQHERILRYYVYYTTFPICAQPLLLVETHQDGRPITVIRAPSDSSTAPLVPPPSNLRITSSSLSHFQLDPPRRSPRLQRGDSSLHSFKASTVEELYLDIDVAASGTWLGCKGYKGVLHTGEPVFAKLWDGWKHSSEEADRESAIYNTIHELWGILVPRLIAHGGWGFCHIVVLEFIKVIRPFQHL